MTPADCQRAAAEFSAAYLALIARSSGRVDVDGVSRQVPAVDIADGTKAPIGMRLMTYTVAGPENITEGVQSLALGVARTFAHAGRGMLFRLAPDTNAPFSAVSPPDRLPCRVTLMAGANPAAVIEIGLRA